MVTIMTMVMRTTMTINMMILRRRRMMPWFSNISPSMSDSIRIHVGTIVPMFRLTTFVWTRCVTL